MKKKNNVFFLPRELPESAQTGVFSELNDNTVNFFQLPINLTYVEMIAFAPPSYLDQILIHIKRQGWEKKGTDFSAASLEPVHHLLLYEVLVRKVIC